MDNIEKIVDYSDWDGLFNTSKEVISDIFELGLIPEVDSLEFNKFYNRLMVRKISIELKDFLNELKVVLNRLNTITELGDYFNNLSNFSEVYSYYKIIPKIRDTYLDARDLFIEFELDLEGEYIPVMNDFYRLQLKNLDILEKDINNLLKIFLGVLLSSEGFVMPYELW